ncbi:MAG: hypothetical protein JWO47_136 [Candidatus Saccharibacteria bacterium]|nr:hypothetical protein [Candidatus Saccharibacteria bacterium]
MSVENLPEITEPTSGTRKMGEPFVPKDGVVKARNRRRGEVILVSYTPPKPRPKNEKVTPLEDRVISLSPNYTAPEPPFAKSPREQFIRPFFPETIVATIDLEDALTIAELLLQGGRVMRYGMSMRAEDVQMTVGIMAQEFSRERDEITKELLLEPGSQIGPYYMAGGVSSGIGLWMPTTKAQE